MSRDEEVELNKDRSRARRKDHSKKNKKPHHRMKPQPTLEELELDDKRIRQEIEELYYNKNPKMRY